MYYYGIIVIVSFISSFLSTHGAIITQPEINGASTALMYLSRFGYIDPSATNPETGSLMAKEAVVRAIMEFQAFAGLNQTGIMDEDTVEMMNTPRCGVVDKVGYGTDARRKKRYALQGSRWKVNDLTYKVTKYPSSRIKKSDVDSDIKRAFQVWADVTELTFTPVESGKVHIEIRFEKGEHGDGDPFDGSGGTLAHAYFPIYGGDAHFDDSETWTVYSYRGTNLFQTAAHEFGHSLGLSHSDVQSALMAPFYRGYVPDFKLDVDDITAIQSLYGKKTTKDHIPPPRPTVPVGPSGGDGDPILCKDGSIDAIVTMSDKETYVFKGKYFWRLIDDGIAKGYPQKISIKFDGLPSDLDAAFTWTNGKTYFFKGSFYWRSTGFSMDEGYPKLISKGFNGIPDHVDAAFVWSGNGKIYFMKGTDYYKFDPAQRPPVASKYPKDISLWEGLPYYLDDAFQYSNGYTYFFKRGKYWRFNDRSFSVDKTDPPFPRQTGPWWFGCPEMGSSTSHDSANTNTNNLPEIGADSSDVDYDDSFNTDDYLNPRIGGPMDYDYYHDSGTSQAKFSSYLSWLIIPLLLRFLCA